VGTVAGKTIFVLAALMVVAIAVALGAEPKLFAGNEKITFLAMAVIAGAGLAAYFVGLSTRMMVVLVGLIVAAYLVFIMSDNSGDPMVLLHRLMGRSY
jgi:uncharacterized membrane protein